MTNMSYKIDDIAVKETIIDVLRYFSLIVKIANRLLAVTGYKKH